VDFQHAGGVAAEGPPFGPRLRPERPRYVPIAPDLDQAPSGGKGDRKTTRHRLGGLVEGGEERIKALANRAQCFSQRLRIKLIVISNPVESLM
jgi:hypothetical protein